MVKMFQLLFVYAFGMFIIFYLISSKQENEESNLKKELPQTFVILTTTVEDRYRFLLPITVKYWQLLGVQTIAILINSNSKNDSVNLTETIKILNELNAIVKVFTPRKLSPATFSQIIRLFGAVLPSINEILSNESILITSDADLVVFNLKNHIPDISNGKVLHLYNVDCCGPISVPPMRGNYNVKQHAISTIGATVQAWKEIMGFNNNVYRVEEIEDYVINEFGEQFFRASNVSSNSIKSPLWYADQSLISYKIDEWKKGNSRSKVGAVKIIRRIDHINWPTAEQFSQMNISNFDDCHLPTMSFMPSEWEKLKPFLKFSLKNDTKIISRFSKYRKNFVF